MAEVASSTTMFGQWLRQRRRSLDLTQTDLARRIGCSVVTVRKIENGERRPSRQMAKLLAEVVGIAPEEQSRFIQFARTDADPEAFRHPVLSLATMLPEGEASDLLAPEAMFALDFPGWINVTQTAQPEQLAHTLLVMRIQSAPIDSPRSEFLDDGRMLCKIFGQGQVVGHLEGMITQEYTHLGEAAPQTPRYISVFFSIDTPLGTIKGYYSGFTTQARNGRDEQVRMHGQVLSVTTAYVDLFQAEVFYEGGIYYPGTEGAHGVFERGILTILPR